MTTSYTANANLQKPASTDRGWDAPLNANADTLDGIAAIGGLCVALTEVPSATLNVKVSAGVFRKSDGTLVSYAGTASQTLTASTVNYLYLTDTGTLTVNTTGFPSSTWHVRLATVTTGSSTVTTVADSRVQCPSSGASLSTLYLTLAPSDSAGIVTVHTGTTHGVQLGSAVTDLLSLWGATPVVQPSGASQAAMAAATAATLTDSTTGTAGGTVSDVGASFVQATLDNNFATLTSQVNKLIADQTAARTLIAALRSALVTAGVIKGSA